MATNVSLVAQPVFHTLHPSLVGFKLILSFLINKHFTITLFTIILVGMQAKIMSALAFPIVFPIHPISLWGVVIK